MGGVSYLAEFGDKAVGQRSPSPGLFCISEKYGKRKPEWVPWLWSGPVLIALVPLFHLFANWSLILQKCISAYHVPGTEKVEMIKNMSAPM